MTELTRRHYGFAVMAISLGIAAGLGLMDIAVRLLMPRSAWDFRYVNDYVQIDPDLGWSNKPNVNIAALDESGKLVEFKTNADGILPREAIREKRPGIIRILLIGDSTTLGRAVPEQERLHRQLERALYKRGIATEVLNAGVEGYATDQALLRMESLGPLYSPDVVIYLVCPDDAWQNTLERDSGANKPRFELLANEEINLHPPKPELQLGHEAAGLATWIQYSALYRVFQPSLRRLRARLGNWDRRNMLGLADETYYSRTAVERLDWKLFEALLARMDTSSRAFGATLYVGLHPAIEEVWEPFIADTIRRTGIPPETYDRHTLDRKVSEIAQRRGVRFVPQIEEFQKRAAEGPFHLLPKDPHCNGVCYGITADLFAARIAAETGNR